VKALAIFVLLVSAVAPAWAQSKRYPPEPLDKDQEKAEHSELWDHAVNPHRTPYESLLAEARQAIDDRTDDQRVEAVRKLDRAVDLLPDEPAAYQLRGDAYMELKEWDKCALDFQAATAKAVRAEATIERKIATDIRRKLGLCQARAGKLADAERTFADVAATGLGGGEILMRLGEVRIAMGKLDEAIGTLSSAADATDFQSQANIRWLLALAYDRARRPAEAITEAQNAARYDRSYNSLKNSATSSLPFLGRGEAEYLLGLAYAYNDPPRSELALAYFRRFVKLAPDSPWRKRAEDHIREIKPAEFPESVDKGGGNAAFDPEAARAAVRKAMPAMRACAAKTPNTIYALTVMKVGPRSAPTTKYKPKYLPPPEGISIQIAETLDAAPRADTDAAQRCIQPIAEKIGMPAIKEKDTYYKAVFLVVGP
jgi:tetratricopeptide (TPR) repeat protein